MANRLNRVLNDAVDLTCTFTGGLTNLGTAFSYETEGLAINAKARRDTKVRNAAANAEAAIIEDALAMDERIHDATIRRATFDAKVATSS
jgi:hypothetical protein